MFMCKILDLGWRGSKNRATAEGRSINIHNKINNIKYQGFYIINLYSKYGFIKTICM